MRQSRLLILALALFLMAGVTWADGGKQSFKAELNGYSEVPAISSTGSGEFLLRVVADDELAFELTYRDLEGTVTTASHVHLGQTSVNGGVSFFICGGGGRDACTPTSGTFSGSVRAADVIGPTGQGLAPLEFEEMVRAIRAGAAYINVHTNKHPGGEIRGQIRGEGNER
jgi:hypothetical protein